MLKLKLALAAICALLSCAPMAQAQRLSLLPPAAAANPTDILPCSQGGGVSETTRGCTLAQLSAAIAQAGNVVVAATNAQLQALPTTVGAVMRTGFYADGDVPPQKFSPSAAPCTISGGDGGSQVPSANGKCWLHSFAADIGDNVKEFGSYGDNVHNDLASMQAAEIYAATHSVWPLLFPSGSYSCAGGTLWVNAAGTATGGAVNGSAVVGIGKESGLPNQIGVNASGVSTGVPFTDYDAQITNCKVVVGAPQNGGYGDVPNVSFGGKVAGLGVMGSLRFVAAQRMFKVDDVRVIPAWPETGCGLQVDYSQIAGAAITVSRGADSNLCGAEFTNDEDTALNGFNDNYNTDALRFPKGTNPYSGKADNSSTGLRIYDGHFEGNKNPILLQNLTSCLLQISGHPGNTWGGAATDPFIFFGDATNNVATQIVGCEIDNSSINTSYYSDAPATFTAGSPVITLSAPALDNSGNPTIFAGMNVSASALTAGFATTVSSVASDNLHVTLAANAPASGAAAVSFSFPLTAIKIGNGVGLTLGHGNRIHGAVKGVDASGGNGCGSLFGPTSFSNVTIPVVVSQGSCFTVDESALNPPDVVTTGGTYAVPLLDQIVKNKPATPGPVQFNLPTPLWNGWSQTYKNDPAAGGLLTLSGSGLGINTPNGTASTYALPPGASATLFWPQGAGPFEVESTATPSPASLQFSPTIPTAPSSTSAFTMMGLGAQGAVIIPTTSGNVLVAIAGNIITSSGVVGTGIKYQVSYGAGTTATAPANGAAVIGSQVGPTQQYLNPTTVTAADVSMPFVVNYRLSNLVVGTSYWIDLAAEAVSATGANVKNLSITASEVRN